MERGKIRIVYVNHIEDGTADLCFMERDKIIPFSVERMYYVHNIKKGSKRGFHAHKKLQQLMFCPYGAIEMELDDGDTKQTIILDKPEKVLILKPGIWREFTSQKDGSVLCVLASEKYSEEDYVRDYEEFLKMVKDGYWKK